MRFARLIMSIVAFGTLAGASGAAFAEPCVTPPARVEVVTPAPGVVYGPEIAWRGWQEREREREWWRWHRWREEAREREWRWRHRYLYRW